MKNVLFLVLTNLYIGTELAFSSEAGMPQLDSQFWLSQIFWLIIIFSILCILLWKLLLPKISENIEIRREKILNDLNEAQNLKDSVQKKIEEYEKIMNEAKNQAKKIIEESKDKVEKDIKIKRKKFEEEIEQEIIEVENQIANLKNNSTSSIKEIATELSSNIIKSIIGTEVNKSNVVAIVEEMAKKNMDKH